MTRGVRALWHPCCLLGRWSVLTYEAPKQSPPALKEEEDGDSNIQVGTSGDGSLPPCWMGDGMARRQHGMG